MKRLQFSTDINAPREEVWKVLWEDATYRNWTSAFSEGSYAVSDWKEGSKVLFLSPGGDGMYAMIAKSVPNEFMSFKHLGELKNGVEQPMDEKTQQWSGAMENYTLTENGEHTRLSVEVDITEEYQDYFNEKFPLAFSRVKALAENQLVEETGR